MKVFKKLWPYISRYHYLFYGGILFVILNVGVSMVPGYINRKIIDDVITNGQVELLTRLLIAYMGVTILRSLFIAIQRYCIEGLSQKTLRDLKQSVYDHLQKMSFDFFNKNKTGELMSRMTGDMEAIRVVIAEGIIQLVRCIFYILFVGFVLIRENIQLTLISLAVSPFIAFFAYRLSERIKPVFSKIREQFSDLNSTVQENISGIRIVKAFHQQGYEMEKFDEENNEYFIKNYKAAKVWAKYFPIIEFLGGVSTVFLLYFGGRLVIQGEITIGVWMQFNSYLWMLIMPMRMLGHIVNMISRAIASGERIFKILETETEIKNKENPVYANRAKGEVEFKNVSLKYDDQYILKDINLHAKPGNTVAIMGATGSGKTSLINLIARYYDATEGEIYIDGIDVKDFDLKSLRKQVSIVMQDVFLFSETLRKNIAYGSPEASLDEIEEAVEIAGAKGFIKEMDEGYKTVVGERGMGLSGGQKQRISLARAILEAAPILILDDATSAVDMETEYKIQKALEEMEDKTTLFIIAHRISSVRNADEIIILKNGEIAERGSHKELLKLKGEYYKIFKEQYKELIDDDGYFKGELEVS
ncbi:ABC-type multidrug transport system, ATPase and permease component [Halobacteroides halobius DSM 5150]|uniref:ABC-type multidrug transport system, ATPase and permease component n=1 Tax=Halobacteroides halobius (strain ATCC 35273 / DSM 5150 / MD-1) TaxID=748449 RepID=L0K9N8_HALHC|nr:ABC transporter ATP-binding protein [Halobacteroides halobius]AGB40793.1 ABC-type multidrug transport system, ATPase and permease component [Halobacteroides halobius DSM 5150]